MESVHMIEKNQLVNFKGKISRQTIDALLQKIEVTIQNPKWMKSILRISYDLITSSNNSGDVVEYVLSETDKEYQIFCKHNKVPKDLAQFIDNTITRLKNYEENRLRQLIRRLTERRAPLSEKGTFFEDIIWSIYNIYRRKYAKIEISYIPAENGYVSMDFNVTFDFNA